MYLNQVSDGVPPMLTDPSVSALTLAAVGLAPGRTGVLVVEVVRRHHPLETVVLGKLKLRDVHR